MQLILVTGLSGSGKSIALRQLEDCGFYCIDNLPSDFLLPVTEHLSQSGWEKVAVALDSRSDVTSKSIHETLALLKSHAIDLRILCLTASTEMIIKRYSESRRQHPLSMKKENAPETLTEAIKIERDLIAPFFSEAHLIDTTGLLPSTLREWIKRFVNAREDSLILSLESFGFKKGLPLASDLVFDVRCLPNPYWDEALRPLTGKDAPVIEFLRRYPEVEEMIGDICTFIQKWLPRYRAQNRHYLTISIGCTGGQHRSVYVVEEIGKRFASLQDSVVIRHRTLDAQHFQI
jgi:UPF0042 nucleotide-binding protein